ncbi:hypothetical protein UPYG_G00130500 [Umbra pygmaea]|uniref:Uncharacterized protein n=1 Tax=Umbra pygmaea TaxID=75934 RepID=A0ABD0XUD3_UMBPY
MVKSLLICTFVLGVVCVAVSSELSVCIEEDGDLRIDCPLKPRDSQINSYEFSMSIGAVETIINTNVSGSSPDAHYQDHSYVEQLEPQGYRLRLKAEMYRQIDTDSEKTYLCKISKNITSKTIEKGELLPCTADQVVVQTFCCLLLSLWTSIATHLNTH